MDGLAYYVKKRPSNSIELEIDFNNLGVCFVRVSKEEGTGKQVFQLLTCCGCIQGLS